MTPIFDDKIEQFVPIVFNLEEDLEYLEVLYSQELRASVKLAYMKAKMSTQGSPKHDDQELEILNRQIDLILHSTTVPGMSEFMTIVGLCNNWVEVMSKRENEYKNTSELLEA